MDKPIAKFCHKGKFEKFEVLCCAIGNRCLTIFSLQRASVCLLFGEAALQVTCGRHSGSIGGHSFSHHY